MKKVLPFILAAIIFAGCGKKNVATPDPNANNAAIIIGKWKDGPTLSIYYTGGKEVYRTTYAAPTTVQNYYQFNTDGTFAIYQLINGVFLSQGSFNYSLTNSNTTLHLTSGSTSFDEPITFPDNNTLVITSTTTSGVIYYLNGINVPADKEVDANTLYRM